METVLGFEPPHMEITFSWGWGLQYTHMAAMSLCVVRPIGRRDRRPTRSLGRLRREPIAVAPAQGWKMEDGHRD